MGKFKKGVRVRLLEQHDGGGPEVGALGTVFAKGYSKGERDVVWDDLDGAHDGEANDGSTNHWYVPKSKLEVVEEEPANPRFTIGDRATALDGEQVTIDSEIDDVDHVWVVNADGKRWRVPVSWLSEAWEPKVGDRVRLLEDNCGLADWGAAGENGTVVSVNPGNTDAWVEFDTSGRWHAQWSSFVPVAAEAQPAVAEEALTIRAGRYYKTRDGRKVGPMVRRETDRWGNRYSGDFVWTDEPGNPDSDHTWQDDGFMFFTGDTDPDDLVAEWTEADEPVVAVEEVAVAEAPVEPKFKVGDRVSIDSYVMTGTGVLVKIDDEGDYLVAVDDYTDGHDGDLGDGSVNKRWFFGGEGISLLTTQPANDNNLVVTITAKNESVADALRTLAAALNAA